MKALALIALVIAAAPARAEVHTYFAPAIDGTRLDACGPAGCGKPAADAYCATRGFLEALTFAREPAVPGSELIRPGAALRVAGADAMVFRQIKCFTPEPKKVAAQ
jgi:hypothetical protein